MRDNLEELLLEINDITGDIDVNDATKFNNVPKLKLKQFLIACYSSSEDQFRTKDVPKACLGERIQGRGGLEGFRHR